MSVGFHPQQMNRSSLNPVVTFVLFSAFKFVV